jgi:chaperonin GroES|tara:strand:+ start:280 stop:585 length:306 start_codon:yes stop_codon:yes gene_type:complete
MRLKPVNDKIVVKPNEKNKEEKTSSGIILPDTVQDGTLIEGKVVAVGDGMYSMSGTLIPVVVDVGDTILYNKNAQKAEHKIDGETYILMSVNEVMSIVGDK